MRQCNNYDRMTKKILPSPPSPTLQYLCRKFVEGTSINACMLLLLLLLQKDRSVVVHVIQCGVL